MNDLTFRSLFERIFGSTITNGFLNKSELALKEPSELKDFINLYERNEQDAMNGCQLCKKVYEKIQPNQKEHFIDRNMDFPSWLGTLERKEILILGESVTGTYSNVKGLKKDRMIGLTYGLSLFINNFKDMEELLREKYDGSHHFWRKLNILFKDRQDNWLEKLYLTDVAKCNAEKKRLINFTCGMKFLIKEIELVSPRLILIQGNDARTSFLPLIQATEGMYIEPVEVELNYKFYNNHKLSAGKIIIEEKKDYQMTFFTIPHTSRTNPDYAKLTFWEDLSNFLQQNYSEFFT